MKKTKVKFIWNDEYVGERLCWYPEEEGNRIKPFSDKYWSKIEILSSNRLKEIQWNKFKKVIEIAYNKSGFYKRKWSKAGITPYDIKAWDDLEKIPVVTKEDFENNQREYPPYGDAFTIPTNEQMKYWQTSGTTSKPRIWCETKEDWENGVYNLVRCFYGYGIRPGWRGFISFSYPPFMAFWHCHYAAEMLGCQVVPKGPLSTLAWINIIKNLALSSVPSFMASTPTYAIRMIEIANSEKIDVKELGIKKIVLGGEPGASIPATKRFIENNFEAEVFDLMGCTETGGPIMFSCKEQALNRYPSLHIVSDQYLVEVVDPYTFNRKEGDIKEGVTVITSLGNRTGMPAIRFLVGDWIKIDERKKCVCGRNFPLAIGGVSSRFDDMIIIKGVNVYPSLIENSVRSIEKLSPEYQIRIDGSRVIILVEAKERGDKDLYLKLSKRLEEDPLIKTSLRFNINVVDPGSLPRSETKSKRIIKEL